MITRRASTVCRAFLLAVTISASNLLGIGLVHADAPALVRIEVQFNFLTQQPNSWTASGAFVDQGALGVDETRETFLGRSVTAAVVPVRVFGPIVAEDGSKIYWRFTKLWFVATPTQWIARGQWHIVSGTGKYSGIKGQGDLEGTIDIVTGEIVDIFTGLVHLPNP